MKKKLELNKLSVKSFVTEVDGNTVDTVKGGTATIIFTVLFCGGPSNEQTGCSGLCCGTLTTQGASGQFGPNCQSQYPNCGSGQIPIENKN